MDNAIASGELLARIGNFPSSILDQNQRQNVAGIIPVTTIKKALKNTVGNASNLSLKVCQPLPISGDAAATVLKSKNTNSQWNPVQNLPSNLNMQKGPTGSGRSEFNCDSRVQVVLPDSGGTVAELR